MAKYKQKPMIVKAELYQEGLEDGFMWLDQGKRLYYNGESIPPNSKYVPVIITSRGCQVVTSKDYVITDKYDGRYLCNKFIFEEQYELIED